MPFEHAQVRHARFGAGEVKSIEGARMCVRFDATGEERTFAYPDAFESFLSTENSPLLSEIHALLDQKKQAESLRAQELSQRLAQLQEEHKKQTRSTRARSSATRTVRAKK